MVTLRSDQISNCKFVQLSFPCLGYKKASGKGQRQSTDQDLSWGKKQYRKHTWSKSNLSNRFPILETSSFTAGSAVLLVKCPTKNVQHSSYPFQSPKVLKSFRDKELTVVTWCQERASSYTFWPPFDVILIHLRKWFKKTHMKTVHISSHRNAIWIVENAMMPLESFLFVFVCGFFCFESKLKAWQHDLRKNMLFYSFPGTEGLPSQKSGILWYSAAENWNPRNAKSIYMFRKLMQKCQEKLYHLESRWLATPIGLSWPLTNRHLLGVAIAIYCQKQCTFKIFIVLQKYHRPKQKTWSNLWIRINGLPSRPSKKDVDPWSGRQASLLGRANRRDRWWGGPESKK